MLSRYYTEEGNVVRLGASIDRGTEGSIHLLEKGSTVPDYSGLVAKIYSDRTPAPPWREEKLKKFIQIFRQWGAILTDIACPLYLLYPSPGRNGPCVGFLMKKVKGTVLAETAFSSRYLESVSWTRVELTALAQDILRKFINLHKAGILMADINPRNILIRSYQKTAFVDVDSYQVDSFPCLVHVKEYTSPRLLDMEDFSSVFRTEDDENYAIAVLLFKLFFVKRNPYSKSGGLTVMQDVREMNFPYPLGYNVNELTPHGPWQRIWHNLPYPLQEGFYNAFHQHRYNSPEQWLKLLDDYKKDLHKNLYPREILIKGKVREPNPIVNIYKDVDPEQDGNLRLFETELSSHLPTGISSYAFLEFGTNEIRGHSIQTDATLKLRTIPFPTGHFNWIDSTGKMDVEKLKENLRDNANWLPVWLTFLKGIKPEITRIIGYGGVALRFLQNREEVINVIREVTGLNVGILTGREEAEALISESDRILNKNKQEGISVYVDVRGTAAGVFIKQDGVLTAYRWYVELGWNTMRNWFFNSAHQDSRLAAELEAHNGSVSQKLQNSSTSPQPGARLVATGVLTRLDEVLYAAPQKKTKSKSYTLDELVSAMDTLDNNLSANRVYVDELAEDIRQQEGQEDSFLTRMLDIRLALPIYVETMKRMKMDRITVCSAKLHDAVVRHTLKMIESNSNGTL